MTDRTSVTWKTIHSYIFQCRLFTCGLLATWKKNDEARKSPKNILFPESRHHVARAAVCWLVLISCDLSSRIVLIGQISHVTYRGTMGHYCALMWKSKTFFAVCAGWATSLKRMGRRLSSWSHQIILTEKVQIQSISCCPVVVFLIVSVIACFPHDTQPLLTRINSEWPVSTICHFTGKQAWIGRLLYSFALKAEQSDFPLSQFMTAVSTQPEHVILGAGSVLRCLASVNPCHRKSESKVKTSVSQK